MSIDYLVNEAEAPHATFLLAHGAGAPMDTPFMEAFALGLARLGFTTARFEFAYMAGRRSGGTKRPPPRAEKLMDEYRAAIAELGAEGPLVIGGKSLGARVASMIARDEYEAGRIAGLVCLGYPFHPPGKTDKPRTEHLHALSLPVLIVQGTRDSFGGEDEAAGYALPANISFHWASDGDHSLVPRRRSGRSREGNWEDAVSAIADWAGALAWIATGAATG